MESAGQAPQLRAAAVSRLLLDLIRPESGKRSDFCPETIQGRPTV